MRHVLIIDDEQGLVRMLAYNLERDGYQVTTAHTGSQGLEVVRGGFDGIVLLDLRLPDVDGLDLVEPLVAANPHNRIVIMTAHSSIDAAIEATKKGAYDFVSKGEAAELLRHLAVTLKNAFNDQEMARRVGLLEEQVSARSADGSMVARSPQMQRVFATLEHLRESNVTVLVTGESGTGKELIARAIHDTGPRAGGAFVAINCAGIPDTLLESELFGHERGAFTGAVVSKKGKFEIADGGTIFLDEIGEMPLQLQAKILRVLQERVVERVGGTEPRPVDVRIISATNRDLRSMVAEGTFRDDLFYRLAVFPLHLPPLRDREGDVSLLAHHFLRSVVQEERKEINGFSKQALHALESHSYPGNVRELQNIVSRAVVVATSREIQLADLPVHIVEATRHLRLSEEASLEDLSLEQAFAILFQSTGELPSLETLEAELIRRALRLCKGNVVEAARSLGVSRATFYRRLTRMGGRDALLREAS